MYNPHATAPTSIGSLEDNRETIGVRELVCLMQGIDGGISARDHWNTCWERTGDLCNRLNPDHILSQALPASPWEELHVTCSNGNGPGFHLVSHLADHLWAWTNESDSSILAGLGKVCSL